MFDGVIRTCQVDNQIMFVGKDVATDLNAWSMGCSCSADNYRIPHFWPLNDISDCRMVNFFQRRGAETLSYRGWGVLFSWPSVRPRKSQRYAGCDLEGAEACGVIEHGVQLEGNLCELWRARTLAPSAVRAPPRTHATASTAMSLLPQKIQSLCRLCASALKRW